MAGDGDRLDQRGMVHADVVGKHVDGMGRHVPDFLHRAVGVETEEF